MQLTTSEYNGVSTFYFDTLHENHNGPEGGHLTELYTFTVLSDKVQVQRSVSSVCGGEPLDWYNVNAEDLSELTTKEACLTFLEAEEAECLATLDKIKKLKEKLVELPLEVLENEDDFIDEDCEDEDEDEDCEDEDE